MDEIPVLEQSTEAVDTSYIMLTKKLYNESIQ